MDAIETGLGVAGVKVSVVIPTTGRESLVRALRSAKGQVTEAEVEIVVVYDGDSQGVLNPIVSQLADIVVNTGGRTGGGNSRNLGAQASTGSVIAWLDDDDEWDPKKTQRQLESMMSSPRPEKTVLAGRQKYAGSKGGRVSKAGPKRLIREDQLVEHYLFRKRPPHGGRPSIYTSTIMCPRRLALQVPWDSSLTRHQDWDLLVRLGRDPEVTFVQVPEAVVAIHMGSARSISASSDWEASLAWAERMFVNDRRTLVDFLAAQTLRYAIQARSGEGVRQVKDAIRRAKKLPNVGPAIIGLAGLLSRRAVEKITVTTAG